MANLQEIKKLWEKQPNDWVIKAATEDLEEYPQEVQEIILGEIKKRGLEGAKFTNPSIIKEVVENVVGEVFNPERDGYLPRYSGLSKLFLPMIIFLEKGCGGLGVLLSEGLKRICYKQKEVPKDIVCREKR